MELSNAGETLEYKWGDVTVLVKKEANEDDHMQAVFAGRKKSEPWGAEQKGDYCRLACRLMVVGWRGVTHKGKEVEYEFDLLKQLPKLPGKSLFIELGLFIIEHTDVQKGATEEIKKS